jgi:enhancing lycopene biosynthesis protein 2
MPHVCVLISGCGFLDGAEIHESVLSLLYLSQANATYQVAAPHKPQMHVVNHHTGEVSEGEQRMVHIEAARIARGPVLDISEIDVSSFDALMLPGGFGAAKNLCDFAINGAGGTIDPTVAQLISDFHQAQKPIGAVCIAPAVLALALKKGTITIGNDSGTAEQLTKLGATHKDRTVTEFVVDREHKIATAPAYMFGEASISEVAQGIEKTISAMLSLC